MEYLIAPTLLNSFDFYRNARGNWIQKALEDIESTIKRKHKEFPPYVAQGQKFEDAVYKFVRKGVYDAGSPVFNAVCERVKGGVFQAKTKFKFDADGKQFVMFGKIDVLLPHEIVDIKTTINYRGEAKYRDGWQGPLYCLSAKKSHLTYVVVEWESDQIYKPVNMYEVPYVTEDSALVMSRLRARTIEFFDFIMSRGWHEDYAYTYSRNNR